VTIRDLRTWLAKRSIREIYALDADVVSTACQYVRFLIKSRLAKNVLLIRLEDAVQDLQTQIEKASTFLGQEIELPERWWEHIGDYAPTNPKSLQEWWHNHPSSSSGTDHLDIQCEPSMHPFWNDILPILH
jgi:hypothetical protein